MAFLSGVCSSYRLVGTVNSVQTLKGQSFPSDSTDYAQCVTSHNTEGAETVSGHCAGASNIKCCPTGVSVEVEVRPTGPTGIGEFLPNNPSLEGGAGGCTVLVLDCLCTMDSATNHRLCHALGHGAHFVLFS